MRVAKVMATIGSVLLVLGVALIPLPGPGWPVVFIAVPLLVGATVAAIVSRLRDTERRKTLPTDW